MRSPVVDVKFSKADRSVYLEHCRRWSKCETCDIGVRSYRHVFYRGHLPCQILFVGEAPGRSEDMLGHPFTGPAGNLLDVWISRCMLHFPVFKTWGLTNLVACRPCDCANGPNREPSSNEVVHCAERLLEMVTMATPKVIVAVGKLACERTQWLRKATDTHIPIMPIIHPAACLRGGNRSKGETELEAIMEMIQWQRKS